MSFNKRKYLPKFHRCEECCVYSFASFIIDKRFDVIFFSSVHNNVIDLLSLFWKISNQKLITSELSVLNAVKAKNDPKRLNKQLSNALQPGGYSHDPYSTEMSMRENVRNRSKLIVQLSPGLCRRSFVDIEQ